MKKINKSFLYKFSSLCIALGASSTITDHACFSSESRILKNSKRKIANKIP